MTKTNILFYILQPSLTYTWPKITVNRSYSLKETERVVEWLKRKHMYPIIINQTDSGYHNYHLFILVIVHPLSQQHVLYSFTTPECVLPALQGAIDTWLQELQMKAESAGIVVEMKTRSVCLPTVVL